METIARDNTSSTSGMLHNTEGALNKATLSAHEVVNSIVGAADEAASKAKPADRPGRGNGAPGGGQGSWCRRSDGRLAERTRRKHKRFAEATGCRYPRLRFSESAEGSRDSGACGLCAWLPYPSLMEFSRSKLPDRQRPMLIVGAC